jgi:hypothetical protein
MSTLAEPALRGFFDEAAREYTDAAEAVGELHYGLRIADQRISLSVAGAALARELLPAFGARVTAGPPARPTAMIRMWEENACPFGAAMVPWSEEALGAGNLVGQADGDGVIAIHFSELTMFDPRANLLLYRVADAVRVPWWEVGGPLRPALCCALGAAGRFLVHGGAVGDRARGGMVVAGRSGSGKTMTALAALAGGLDYVADDYFALDLKPEPRAWNVYGTAKIDAGHGARFPDLGAAAAPRRTSAADEKAILDIGRLSGERVVDALRIRSVICPRVSGGRTRWRRIGGPQALLALAPSTAIQLPYDRGAVVAPLAELARRVPCFALDVGDDMDELFAALEEILDEAADSIGADRA